MHNSYKNDLLCRKKTDLYPFLLPMVLVCWRLLVGKLDRKLIHFPAGQAGIAAAKYYG